MKLLFLALLTLTPFASANLQADAERNVSRFISSRAGHDTYEALSFGKLEKLTIPFEKTEIFRRYQKQQEEDVQMSEKLMRQVRFADSEEGAQKLVLQAQGWTAKAKEALEKQAAEKRRYMPPVTGYRIFHRYRLTNPEGAVRLKSGTFYLDRSLKVLRGK